MRVLVTGFEPWGDVPRNPTQELVEGLDESGVVGLVLPVSFERAGRILRRAIAEERPDAILGLGLAPRSAWVRVEVLAVNVMHSEKPDADGARPVSERIDPEGPAAYFTTLPNAEIVGALRSAGVPARLSHHAGTFLCNFAAYTSLRQVDVLGLGSVAGFIHVPYSTEAAMEVGEEVPSLPRRSLEEALRLALGRVRAAVRGRRRPP